MDRGSQQQEERPVGKAAPRFRHEIIDPNPPGSQHDVTLLHDLTGNGLPDVIIGSKRGDFNLMWYENPGWARYDMASAPNLEAGGVVVDVNGDGRPDVVVGQQWGGHEQRSRIGPDCGQELLLGGIAEGGTRTLTPLRERDFESRASANSATSACVARADVSSCFVSSCS